MSEILELKLSLECCLENKTTLSASLLVCFLANTSSVTNAANKEMQAGVRVESSKI